MKKLILLIGLVVTAIFADINDQPNIGGKKVVVATNGYSGILNVITQLNVGIIGEQGRILIRDMNNNVAIDLFGRTDHGDGFFAGGIGVTENITNLVLNEFELVYATDNKTLGSIAAGSAGQVLISGGAGVVPSFQAVPSTLSIFPIVVLSSTNVMITNNLGGTGYSAYFFDQPGRLVFTNYYDETGTGESYALQSELFSSVLYENQIVLTNLDGNFTSFTHRMEEGTNILSMGLNGDDFVVIDPGGVEIISQNDTATFLATGAGTGSSGVLGSAGYLELHAFGGHSVVLAPGAVSNNVPFFFNDNEDLGPDGSVFVVSSGSGGSFRFIGNGQVLAKNGASTNFYVAGPSGYTGAGTLFLSDDGTYKAGGGGGGDTIWTNIDGNIQLIDGLTTTTFVIKSLGDIVAPELTILSDLDTGINAINIGFGSGTNFTESVPSSVVAIGFNALNSFTGFGGFHSTAVGDSALEFNTGDYSSAFGYHALRNAQGDSHDNNAFGDDALVELIDGKWNNSFGSASLSSLTNGFGNVAIGESALYSLIQGTNNLMFGGNPAGNLQFGNDNIFIGNAVDSANSTLSEGIGIGSGVTVTNDFEVVIGTSQTVAYIFPGAGWTGSGTLFLSDDGTYKTAGGGGGGTVGTMINSGTPVVGNVTRYTDTTGTNMAPSGALTLGSGTNTTVNGQLIFSPGTTNVLVRNGGNLVYTNGSSEVFNVVQSAAGSVKLGVTTAGHANILAGTGGDIYFGVNNNGGGDFAMLSSAFLPTSSGTRDLGSVSSSFRNVITTGVSSYATDTAVTIASTGWTNTFGKNAVVYMDGIALVYTVYNNALTPVYTNSVSVVGASVMVQPSGKVIITSGTLGVGRATPF